MGTMITFRPGYQHGWAWFLMFSIACPLLVYSTAHAISGNETDRLALLAFKAKITADPLGVMNLWNDSTHFCSWFGITCGNRHRRVTELILDSSQLGGTISPHIGNLTFLRYVSLTDNSLIDHIPPAVGYLRRLKELYLYNNSLSGEIPKELGTLSKLQLLAIHYNNLTREIPPSLGNLSSLHKLSAAYNNLVGSIPDALGRLNQLTILGLGANQLSGTVPSSIFNLSSLTRLDIGGNQLSGTVPSSIFNLSSLTLLDIGGNHLHGYLPSDLFLTLPNLNFLSVWNNQFSGPIPTSLSNASNLGTLYLHSNLLTGEVPSLQKLNALLELRIWNNSLGTRGPGDLNFLCSLTNATGLQVLDIGINEFGGSLPECISNLSSKLTQLWLNQNKISGAIPAGIGGLVGLNFLRLDYNNFFGTIPESLGNLSNLSILDMSGNHLQGKVPSLHKLNALEELSIFNNSLGTRGPGDLNFLYSLTNATGLQLLDIGINKFGGSLPECISNLSSKLTELWLDENKISGAIPAGIGSLVGLNILRLDDNNFSSTIPESIGNLPSLGKLDVSSNHLQGKVPSLHKLNALEELFIWNNSLGTRSPGDLNFLCSLTNATGLQVLDIGVNEFGGSLPECISNLSSKLTHLWLNQNKLSGAIPASIGSLFRLNNLRLDQNNFSGTIPEFLGNLPNLSALDMSDNNLQGNIPPSLGKCTTLQSLGLAGNNLSGSLPLQVIGLSLVFLSIQNNNIDGSLPQSLCNATKLDVLIVSNNLLKGTIPDCLVAMSTTLGVLDLAGNSIGGSIPDIFGQGCKLESLKLNGNVLHGTIPRSLANCKDLKVLDVGNNQLRDTFPCELKTLSQLQVLILRSNKLRGNVACLGEDSVWPMLQIIDLASNHFDGEITTRFISKWKSMTTGTKELQSKPDPLQYNSSNDWYYVDSVNLTFKGNDFELYVLKIFTSIDMSNNDFHGEIPREFGNLNTLIVLNLSHNSLSGNIPSSFGNLSQLESLDLSCNSLHGNIPQELAKLNFLESLNLSFNKFVGPIPTGKQLQLFDASSYQGNQGLYGPPLTPRTPLAPTHAPGSVPPTRALSTKLKVGIATGSGIIGAALLVSLIILLTFRKKKQANASSSSEFSFPQVSYQDLHRATNGFSSNKLIGVGYFASVYKGILHEGEPLLAIKVFNLERRGATRSFMAECEALRNVRHRNLVKVITACSSTNYQGNEFKALIYEFMPNGSLEDWLHPVGEVSETQEAPKNLTLLQRLSIAIDVASALQYLHGECETPIVHCDLKPSNVLLDNELTAHVSDFGIAKLLTEDVEENASGANLSSSIGVRGTIGYAAPEYALGSAVSIHGDIYSYGILLLEMFTGIRPTHDIFKEGWSLHQYATRALYDGVEIIDPTLVQGNRGTREEGKIIECLTSILDIGVACSVESPRDRMNIIDASQRLGLIKKELLKLRVLQ